MNKRDRKDLQRAIELIEEAKDIIYWLAEQEREKFDNLSEGLQATEKGQVLETNSDDLLNAVDDAESLVYNLVDIKDR